MHAIPEPRIVYQHADWVVLNKPEGFSVEELTVAYQSHFSAFHPAHRLDKDTSGLWLIALNADANSTLSRLFAERQIHKHYLALTHKTPKKKQGKIIGDMVRSRRGQWQLKKSSENPAITLFKSLGLDGMAGKRLVICEPLTGKTHQIRVAMKSLGSPIVGDNIYDSGNAQQEDRLYLHACALAFQWQDQFFRFVVEPQTGQYFAHPQVHQMLHGNLYRQ